MRKAWGVLVAALLVMGAARQARAVPAAGMVVAMEGSPQVQARGASSYQRLKHHAYVREGDTIKTGNGERVSIILLGGSEFRINENSEFRVESGGNGMRPASLFTALGEAWTRLINQSGLSGIQVRTPMAVAAVRGTEADVDLSNPAQLAVKVYDGHVDLLDAAGGKTLQRLHANQFATIGGGGSVTAPRSFAATERGTWQNGLQVKDLNGAIRSLDKEAQKTRVIKWTGPDGKEHTINLKHK